MTLNNDIFGMEVKVTRYDFLYSFLPEITYVLILYIELLKKLQWF